jgi:hypothetical protein
VCSLTPVKVTSIRCMEVLPEHLKSRPQSQNTRPQNAMTPSKKPSIGENFSTKFSRHVKNAMPTATISLVAPMT